MPTDYGNFYKFIRGLLRLSSKRATVRTFPKAVAGPVVYVSHHRNMYGPVTILKWHPEFVRTWIFSAFMDYRTCYDHYVAYTLTERLGFSKGVAKVVAAPLAWFMTTLTKSARGIPVYRQSRKVIETMQQSVETLEQGTSLLIFPDVDYSDDSAKVKEIYDGFLYIDKYYYRKTNKHIPFVPIVAIKETQSFRVGDPIYFSGEGNFINQRKIVAAEIQQSLNALSKEGSIISIT